MSEEEVELLEVLKKLLNFVDVYLMLVQIVVGMVSKVMEQLVFKYIVGETIVQVIKIVEWFCKEKMGFIIDLLGEVVIMELEVVEYW